MCKWIFVQLVVQTISVFHIEAIVAEMHQGL